MEGEGEEEEEARRGDRKRKREMREGSERERGGERPEQRNGFWSFHGTSGAGAEEGTKGIRTAGEWPGQINMHISSYI